MKVWIVTIYDPLPLMAPHVRPMRWGMMIEALKQAGHEVKLWTATFDHITHQHLKNESTCEPVMPGISIQYLHGCGYSSDTSPKRWLHSRQMAREFLRIARADSERPDIIITQIPALEVAEAVVDFGKEQDIPTVVDIRDLWPDGYIRWLPAALRPYVQWLLWTETRRVRKIMRTATAITAVSQTYLAWGERHAGGQHSDLNQTFSLGYPSAGEPLPPEEKEKIRREFRQHHKLEPDDLVVLFAGTFCGSYDLAMVFEAARKLKNDGKSKLRIVIAGKGEGETELRRQAADCDNVVFAGWLDAHGLREALEAADIGIAPYATHAIMSLPNKPFEYMATGLPMVNSLKGELWTLVQENRIGMCYENAEQLYQTLRRMEENRDETMKMAQNARILFENNFTGSKIYSGFVKHLDKVINKIK